jgi:hypothetical protein
MTTGMRLGLRRTQGARLRDQKLFLYQSRGLHGLCSQITIDAQRVIAVTSQQHGRQFTELPARFGVGRRCRLYCDPLFGQRGAEQ